MKWVKVFCLSLIVSVGVVKMTWAADEWVGEVPELSARGCKVQAESFGLALLARAFLQDDLIHPPGADGLFSYDSMGFVRNFLYKPQGTSVIIKRIKVMCYELGESVFQSFEASLGLTYAERKQAWESYRRTPEEYLAKYHQTPLEHSLQYPPGILQKHFGMTVPPPGIWKYFKSPLGEIPLGIRE